MAPIQRSGGVVISAQSRINGFSGKDVAGGDAIDPSVTKGFNQAINNAYGHGKRFPATFVAVDPLRTDQDLARRADEFDNSTQRVMLAQYAPMMPVVPFGPPLMPEAMRGTPQNEALTTSTGRAVGKIVDTIRNPADLPTVARRLKYVGHELAIGHIGTVLGHLIGVPFPDGVDSPNVLAHQRAAQSSGAFDKPVGFPGTPLPPPPPLVTPAAEPTRPEPIGGGYRSETSGINKEGLIPPQVDHRLPGYVPPEMPVDLNVYASANLKIGPGELPNITAKLPISQPRGISAGNVTISDERVRIEGRLAQGTYGYVITKDGKLKLSAPHYYLSEEAASVGGIGSANFVDGRFKYIVDDAGHYQPTGDELLRTGAVLKKNGLTTRDFRVLSSVGWKPTPRR
jgi:hypothetical protein